MRSAVFLGVAVVVACSSGGERRGGGPESVSDWSCCAFGATTGSCACYEATPGSALGCFPSVGACAQADGGVECCAATSTNDGWLCECWPVGAACGAPSASMSVASCPP